MKRRRPRKLEFCVNSHHEHRGRKDTFSTECGFVSRKQAEKVAKRLRRSGARQRGA